MNRLLTFVFLASLLSISEQTFESISNRTKDVIAKTNPPEGYQYFAGLGSYKFVDQWETFENAELICEIDGGHLAIINSQDEANTLVNVFLPYYKPGQAWPRLGFGDFFKKGDFRTIFGEPLSSTGYLNWAPEEPKISFERNCGCMNIEGLMGAQCCDCNRWFICELE